MAVMTTVTKAKTTCIYGLYDPRNPDQIMYVGKGLEKRARKHWKSFLSRGYAVNARLRRWFQKLVSDGIKPYWKFLEENLVEWETAEQNWIAYWRERNPDLCNVFKGGNQVSEDASVIGGRLGGIRTRELHPNQASEMGKRAHILHPNHSRELMLRLHRKNPGHARRIGLIGGARVRELYPNFGKDGAKYLTKDVCQKGGMIGGRRVHELYPNLASENGRKYGWMGVLEAMKSHPNLQSKAGKVGGKKTHELYPDMAYGIGMRNCHIRWHVKRNSPNPNCQLCRPDFFDIWEGQACLAS